MSVDLVNASKKFDNKTFNVDFDKYIEQRHIEEERDQNSKLNKLNSEIRKKRISEMSINEFMIEWKISVIGFINDVINLRFNTSILFADNRLFFLGITIVLTVMTIYICHLLSTRDNPAQSDRNINISLNISNARRSFIGRLLDAFKK
jgi:hypothetical protein